MAQAPPELLAHREWLGQIDPVGLVVSPNVLVRQGVFVDRQKAIDVQTKLTALVGEPGGDDAEPQAVDPVAFFREILEWPESILAGSPSGPSIPDTLVAALPEYEDHIRPTYALASPERTALSPDRVATCHSHSSGIRVMPGTSSKPRSKVAISLIS